MYAIQTQNTVKKYKNGVQALNGINISVKTGEIFSLLGQNGAGKSTLIKILTTYLKPTSGKVIMFDQDIHNQTDVVRSAIACVAQQTSIDTHLSLEENMMFQSRLYKIPKAKAKEKIEELIRDFELEQYRNYPVSSYSGGVKRRLDIALNMMSNPKILFLDEPTVGMDLKHRQKFWEQIKKLQTAGKTFLITSHYLEELQNVVQRFLILKDGSIAFAGTLQELQQNGQKVTFRFTSVLDKSLFTKLPGVLTVKNYAMNYIIQTTEPNELIQELVPYLPAIKNLSIEHDSLNELFLEVTGGTYNVVSK